MVEFCLEKLDEDHAALLYGKLHSERLVGEGHVDDGLEQIIWERAAQTCRDHALA